MATITSPRSESPAHPLPRITSPQIPHSPSVSGTPTSSVRPSIDLPTRTSSASQSRQQQNATATATTTTTGASSANPQSQRRNRAALRDYYNLKAKQPPSAAGGSHLSRTASIASNASDSTVTSTSLAAPDVAGTSVLSAQLDDPSFDAEAHVSELLKTAGLRDILRTESVLVSEIRTLDGERKALVYDNYSKLIKAVGTIAEMQKGMHKTENDRFGSGAAVAAAAALGRREPRVNGLEGVEKLGAKLDALVTVVKELAPERGLADQKAGAAPRRDWMKQKDHVQWVADGPKRLRELVQQEEYTEARREHEMLLEALSHWKGVRGVEEIRAKCAKIMENAKQSSEDHEEEDDEDDDKGGSDDSG